MNKLDLHTHILPERWPDLRERYGYGGFISLDHIGHDPGCGCSRAHMMVDGKHFRTIDDNCWDPKVRIKECDELGVGMQVISTVPVMFGYWAKPEHTLDLSMLLNDHLAGVCRDFPGKFIGLGTIPMNAPKLAIRELERCVKQLGFAGVQIATNVNGVNLGDPSLREFFRACAELDACVFVHPWDMLGAGFTTDPQTPAPPTMHPRLNKHWLAWLVGMPAETCLAMCSVLFSGLLQELPNLRICFAHGGGSFPGTLGRIQHGFEARPDLCQIDTKVSPAEQARNAPGLFVDSLVHEPEALRTLLRLFGAERVALGSDYPFPLGEERPGAMIDSMSDLSTVDREWLLRKSALKFLGTRFGG